MKKNSLAIVVALLTVLPALGEELNDTIDMKELTVVATKENSPYRQQALAVSTLNAQMVKSNRVTSLKHVSCLVPNFFMPDYGSRLTSAAYIRGVGSRINTPAVGLYVDDIPYLDKSAFDFNLFDVERIDVLRGPQGTIYGRNTLGGLVKVYSHNPMEYEGTDVTLGYASKENLRRASVMHYHHPAESFAFSGGGYYEGSDGFFKNDLTGRKVDDSQAGGARLRGIWTATERLSFDVNAKWDYSREGAYPYFYEGALNPAAEQYAANIGQIAANRVGSYRRNMLNVGLNTEYRMNRFTLNSVTGYQYLNDRMFMDQDFLPDDIYTLTQKQRINTLSEELTLKGKVTDWWDGVLGANVLYQDLHSDVPVVFMSDGVNWLTQTINGSLPDLTAQGMGPMSVTLRNRELQMGGVFDTPSLNAAFFHQSNLEVAKHLTLSLGVRVDYERNHMEYDAPGSVDFDFAMTSANPRNSVNLTNQNAAPLLRGMVTNDYLHLLPKVALKYEFGAASNVYASVSRGSRSGGYNVQMFSDLLQTEMRSQMMTAIQTGTEAYLTNLFANVPPIPGFDPNAHINMIMGRIRSNMPAVATPDVALTTTYKPEYNWNYEVGTHLNTADHRLQADASLFWIDTRDQQIARFSPQGLGRMMVNAGRSRSYGAELSGRWNPNRHLSFAANYGYTHSAFRDYDDGYGVNYKDNYVPFAPRHTVGADASYTFFLGDGWAKGLTLGATYSGAGKIYWTESNSACQDYYNLLAARAVLNTKWAQLEVWGRNLTQTKYNTFYFESMGRGFSQHGKPLQVGVDVRLHF